VTYARRELGEAAQREFARTLELAEDLNARVIPYEGAESADRLATLIAAEGVNHVVLPHRRRGVLQRLASRSLADQLMLSVPDLDVHLVGERERA
jgi:K+-sensing histidine kinase KdpD